jgi:hypothetical protein
MLALLTTDLPQGMPRPNRVIDSGRGYWGYWKLAAPQPVDGRANNMNGSFTEAVERYGRGIEQAFGDRFADGCRNIDRIARLPGTVNMIEAKAENLIGDRAYDSDPLDEELRNNGIEMIAPHRSNRIKPPTQDRRRLNRYMRRWLVEAAVPPAAAKKIPHLTVMT